MLPVHSTKILMLKKNLLKSLHAFPKGLLGLNVPSLTSAYTEPFPINTISAGLSAEEDHGRTSEEEEGVGEPSFDRQVRQMKGGVVGVRTGKKVNMTSE